MIANLKLTSLNEELYRSLEELTNIPKEEFISNVVNGIDQYSDLLDLNRILRDEKENPQDISESLSYEEGLEFLGY